jgi:hypothetical protein
MTAAMLRSRIADMIFRTLQIGSLVCLLAVLAGCGPKQAPVPESQPIGSAEQLKQDLSIIAEHGTGDSALQPIEMGIQDLDASVPHKEELTKKKTELMRAGTPEQRKKIAQEMLDLLGGSAPAAP